MYIKFMGILPVETAMTHADGRTVGYDEIGAIYHYAKQFNLPTIIDHFWTGKVQASSYVDPEQPGKRHVEKFTVARNSICQGRTHS